MGKVLERVECECNVVAHVVRLTRITMTLPSGLNGNVQYTHCSNSAKCLERHGSLDKIPGCLLLKTE